MISGRKHIEGVWQTTIKLLFLLLAVLLPGIASAQFTVTGKVSSVSSQSESAPLSGALVRVLGDSGTVSDTTAADGSFRITAPTIEGRWGVIVTKTGYLRFAKELQSSEIGESGKIIELNVALLIDSQAVAKAIAVKEVTIQARRYPPREDQAPRAGEQRIKSEGEIYDFLSQMMAGAVQTPEGSNIGGEATKNTVDGLEVFGTLPRTFAGFVGTSSNLDPASSGGSTLAYETSTAATKNLFLSLSNPKFIYSNKGVHSRNESSSQTVAYRGAGSIGTRWKYLFDGDLSQRVAPQSSLNNYNSEILGLYNIPKDSVARLMSALNGAGIAVGGNPGRVINRAGHGLFRLGWGGFNPNARSNGFLTALATFTNSNSRFSPTEATTHGVNSGSTTFDIGAGASTRIWGRFLHDAKVSASIIKSEYRPDLLAAEGVVSLLPTSVTSALIGGSSMPKSGSQRWRVLASNQLIAKRGEAHRVSFGVDAMMEGYSLDAVAPAIGRYTFQTLGDFEALQPSSFYRRGGSSKASARSSTFALYASDRWKMGPTLSATIGLRGEYTHLFSSPELNQALLNTLSLRNDKVPQSFNLAPRVGVSWIYGTSRTAKWNGGLDFSYAVSSSGLGPQSIIPVMQQTGLSDGIRDLYCVGSAIQPIDYSVFTEGGASVASSGCSGASTSLLDTLPAVRMFGSSYKPAQRHVSSVSFSARHRRAGQYRLSLYNQYTYFGTSTRDANFNNTAQFGLADEGNRPVYVQDANIVAATGRISASGARANSSFGRVLVSESDTKSRLTQLSLTGERQIGATNYMQAGYSFTNGRRQQRGSNGTTAGDPNQIDWVDDPYPVHSLMALVQSMPFKGLPRVSIISKVKLHSGFKFTPMIDSDINGDGSANDRAFVFSPAASGDADLRAGINQLLTNSPGYVRRCLKDQIGRVAKHNSCSTPWNMGFDMELYYSPPKNRDWPIMWVLKTQNLLAAVDRGLHGAMDAKGWGASRMPDPTLLRVAGFDPSEQKFLYEVNPRFGDVSTGRSPNAAPFSIVLEARVHLTRSRYSQAGRRVFDQLTSAMVGKNSQSYGYDKADIVERTVARLFSNGLYSNPVPYILRDADTLDLSIEQENELRAMGKKVDAVIVESLRDIGDSVRVAYQRNRPADVGPVTEGVNAIIVKATKPLMLEIAKILSPYQMALLSPDLAARLK